MAERKRDKLLKVNPEMIEAVAAVLRLGWCGPSSENRTPARRERPDYKRTLGRWNERKAGRWRTVWQRSMECNARREEMSPITAPTSAVYRAIVEATILKRKTLDRRGLKSI